MTYRRKQKGVWLTHRFKKKYTQSNEMVPEKAQMMSSLEKDFK